MIWEVLDKEYSVYKFSQEYIFDETLLHNNEFISVTKTADETSVVFLSGVLEGYIAVENGWKILKICGILDFNQIGILSKISNILAIQNISIFVISTYNTDYIMVKNKDINKALQAVLY